MTNEEELQRALSESRFADAVVLLVAHHRYATFVEIERLLEGKMNIRGDLAIFPGDNERFKKKFIWANMSQEFADLINELTSVTKRIYIHPSSTLTYLVDGKAFASKHWVPVTFCTFPYVRKRRRRQ